VTGGMGLDPDPIESDQGLDFPFEHDLIRKPVSTFRDHALSAGADWRYAARNAPMIGLIRSGRVSGAM